MMKQYLAFIPVLSAVLAGAQPSHLDPTFNKTGYSVLRPGYHEGFANSVVLQGNGSILVSGASSGNTFDFSLVALRPDGSLNSSFGTAGGVITPVGNAYDGINVMALDREGGVVVAGASDSAASHRWTLARYQPNGSLDITFAANGLCKLPTLTGDVTDLKVQDDGKLVACGWLTSSPAGEFGLLRLLPNGVPDATFGAAGVVRLSMNGAMAQSLVLQPDGKIIVSGFSWGMPPRRGEASLLRFNTDGTLDASFGNGGIIIRDWSPEDDEAAAVLLQPDGKIILAGNARDNGANYIVVERYLSNGQPDASFGQGGQALNPATYEGWCHTAVLMPDGRIVVAGGRRYGAGAFSLMSLYGYLPDGSPDTSFGTHGSITTSIGKPSSEIRKLVLQADGRLVAVGYAGDSVDALSQMVIVRYRPMPSPLAVPVIAKTELAFNAWPVPLSGQLHIAYALRTPGPVSLELRDAAGRVVQRWDEGHVTAPGHQEHQLSLSPDIASGVYSLCLFTADGRSSVMVCK